MFRDSSKLEIQLNIIKILKKEYTEKKEKKGQYGREGNKNLTENEKLKLAE